MKPDVVFRVFGDHLPEQGVGGRLRINAGHKTFLPAYHGGYVPFDDFTDPLAQGLFGAVARGCAVELVDGEKPVKGHQKFRIVGQVEAFGPSHGQIGKNFPGDGQVVGVVMDRGRDQVKGDSPVLEISPGIDDKVLWISGKAVKTEPLHQFHDRAGFSLFRGGAFPHLLGGAGQAGRVRAAHAEKNGDIQAAGVNANRLL